MIDEESPVVPGYSMLVMEERDKLSLILNDPVFKKAWRNAEVQRPSAFPSGHETLFEGQFGDNRAAKQLARIQGWELHKAALLKQTIEIVPKKKANSEEYPPQGTLEADVKRSLPNK